MTAHSDRSTGADNDNSLYHDSNTAQELSEQEILSMKASGVDGSQIVTALVESSKTFKARTEYSQEKYLARKQKKFVL